MEATIITLKIYFSFDLNWNEFIGSIDTEDLGFSGNSDL